LKIGVWKLINIVGTEQYSVQKHVDIKSVDIKSVGTEQYSVPTGTNTKTGTENIKSNYGLLSKIVKSYKEIFIKIIHKQYNNYEFQWQRSFYDHIIRNENALRRIREYIRMNPIKWEFDKNNRNQLCD